MANGSGLPVVVIDPGHGGTTKVGGSSANNATGPNGLLEKDLTLDLAQRVAAALAGSAQVLLTRTTDVNLSLSARAAVAQTNGAAVFVSIHLNGFSDPAVDGTEAWVARNASADSRTLARVLIDRLLPVTNAPDRGVRESNFGVLDTGRHLATTAASLVEVAFLTNPAQARRLADPAYLDQIAQAIAAAIRDMLARASLVFAADRVGRVPSFGLDATIDYDAPGLLWPTAQPSGMTCWATVATMMVSWRDQMGYPITAVMDMAGPAYRAKFDANGGLSGAEKGAFLAALGLQAEPPMDYAVEGLLGLLQTYGPIWVTTDEDPSEGFAVHARIVTGMVGDGTVDGTMLRVVDPAGGRRYQESFRAFGDKFDEVARGDMRDGGDFRPQVVHFKTPLATGRAQTWSAGAFAVNGNGHRTGSAIPGRALDAVALRLGVPGGLVMDPFYRSPEDRERRVGRRSRRPRHLGIDVTGPAGQTADGSATDPRRGLPVYATVRPTIPLAELNAVAAVVRNGNQDVAQDGFGIAGQGEATLREAIVDVQPWAPAANDRDSYGGVIGLACHYDYLRPDGTSATFTLYVEYLHLITPTYPPKDASGRVVSTDEWQATGKGIGFGPRMQQGARLSASELTGETPVLVGYLGATETPHVHVQVGFAPGSAGYVHRPRVDPTIALLDATTASLGWALATAEAGGLSPEELGDVEGPDDELLQEQPAAQSLAVPWRSVRSLALERNALGAVDARWAPDDRSPDYRHLGQEGRSQRFAFDAALLERLCRINRFDLDGGQWDRLLFGLRGCRLLNGASSGPVTSVQLDEDLPDHQAFHCVLGVWNRATGQLSVFQASTVPNWRLMEAYRQGGDKANLLPTGRYVYRVGTHRPNKPSRIPGAFIQHGPVVVLRTVDDLVYTVRDMWDSGHVGDNIHPGRRDLAAEGPFFSSAGCQTIPGDYGTGGHVRAWAEFRTAAGLGADSPATENGRTFVYVLLTGREARLAAVGVDPSDLSRLRFGSSGTDVQALQQGLTAAGQQPGASNGVMDVDTTMAYIRWQQARDMGAADGVVTPRDAQMLGFDLIGGTSAQSRPMSLGRA